MACPDGSFLARAGLTVLLGGPLAVTLTPKRVGRTGLGLRKSRNRSEQTYEKQLCIFGDRRPCVRHFGGRYMHTLVRGADGVLRIRLQRVDMFNSQASFDYVLQVWV